MWLNSCQECHVCSSICLVSFRSGKPEISSIQSGEDAELVEEKGTNTGRFSQIAHVSVLVFQLCLNRVCA